MKTHYITCLLWSSNNGDSPLDEFDTELSVSLDDKITKDCLEFEAIAIPILERYKQDSWTYDQLGHDFALTRNGHGTGFWDREEIYGEKCAKLLTLLSERFGEMDVYLGDDERTLYA